MTLSDLIPGGRAARAALAFGLATMLALAAWTLLTEPGRQRQRAALARAAAVQAQGQAGAARDAAAVTASTLTASAAVDDLTRKNDADIQAAPGARDPVSPGVAGAGRRALCLRDAYRDRADCHALLGAGPAGPHRPDPGR